MKALLRWRVLAVLGSGALAGAAAAESAERSGAAKQRPLWEIGFGVAPLRLPDYRGADQSRNYLLPLPYVIYRGDWLRADREGARALLLEAKRVEVDVSLAAAAPARNNSAREGMPELAARVEVGPSANFELWRSLDRRVKVELRAPLRAAYTVQRSPRYVGLSFTPVLNLDLSGLAGDGNLGVQAGPVFGDRRYHEYLYGVGSEFATAQRPEFEARGGYAGWQALAGASRHFDDTWVGVFIRHDSLRGAAIASSPLVKSLNNLTVGFGVAWIFRVSDQLVAAEQ